MIDNNEGTERRLDEDISESTADSTPDTQAPARDRLDESVLASPAPTAIDQAEDVRPADGTVDGNDPEPVSFDLHPKRLVLPAKQDSADTASKETGAVIASENLTDELRTDEVSVAGTSNAHDSADTTETPDTDLERRRKNSSASIHRLEKPRKSQDADGDVKAAAAAAEETSSPAADPVTESESPAATEESKPSNADKPVKEKAQGKRIGEFSLLVAIRQSLISEFRPVRLRTDSPLERRQQQVLLYRRQRGAAGTLLLMHALLAILLMIVWAIIPRHLFGVDKLALDGALFSTLLTQGLTVLVPAVFVMFLYNMDIALVAGKQAQSLSVFGISALIGIPAAIAFSGLNNVTLFVLTKLGFHPTAESLLGQIRNPSTMTYVLLILVTALIPAIAEELMFRGVIQTSLSLSGRKGLSLFLMATAFALYHIDPFFLVAPFCAGLYLGFVRQKSGNLYTSMLTHFVMNTTLVLLQPVLPLFTSSMAFAGNAGKTAFYASLIAAAVSLVTLIPLTSAFSAYCEKAPKVSSDPIYRRLQQEQWFPADWKFLLALVTLFITMLVVNA